MTSRSEGRSPMASFKIAVLMKKLVPPMRWISASE